MFKILEKEWLNVNTFKMILDAPMVAHSCLPGQFVIVRDTEDGERIPLTICDYDRENKTITIVVPCGCCGTPRSSFRSCYR